MKGWMILLLVILFAGISWYFYHAYQNKARFTGRDRSIVVLPFVSPDKNPANEYFSDGITDEIILKLSGIPGLKVIPRQTSMTFRNKQIKTDSIARVLHVTTVLEGEVEKFEDSFSIRVRLTDTRNGNTIWSAEYRRDKQEIFITQIEIAELIAEKLETEKTDNEVMNQTRRPTQNLEAYNQFLQGRYYYFKKNAGSLRKAIGFFNRAIALDSGFSRSWSGLADCYSALGYGSYELPATAFLQAETAVRKALELDSSLADPHTSLGYIQFYYYWNWKEAEREFLKAIQLDPNYVLAYTSYGYYLTAMERFPESRLILEKAVELDPLSSATVTDLGFNLFYRKHYEEAVQTLSAALTLNPKNPMAHIWMGRSLQEQKKYPEAILEYLKTLEVYKNWPVGLAAIGHAQGSSGLRNDAKKSLEFLHSISDSIYVTPYGIALVYASLMDSDNAFKNLEMAYGQRSNWLVWLKQDPRWANIRNDKRFDILAEKIGLPRKTGPFTRQ